MRLLSKVWGRWLKLANIIGTIQMIVILSIIYWSFLAIIAIPFKMLADPLSFRAANRARWIDRHHETVSLESMRKQG